MKKKMIGIILFLFVIYIFYYDISIGSLPVINSQNNTEENTPFVDRDESPLNTQQMEHQLVKVKRGDTVISIVEELYNGPIPVSMEQLLNDFEALNNNLKPEQLQAGQTYKFPLYDF
ncbi:MULTISPECIES: LysM domain-containing protein [Bacillaceae]|uniref:LysM peptidoglycan-binding domain-containing protein n=1 Tax=Bacillaceae TaxID=186817 RepID=UPI001BDF2F7A|nr:MULTISPECIES: LysM domain-containing protein [Bacillaceae]MDX8359574.1 LysM domain-containing protein [Cytobacillus sp. IB215316]